MRAEEEAREAETSPELAGPPVASAKERLAPVGDDLRAIGLRLGLKSVGCHLHSWLQSLDEVSNGTGSGGCEDAPQSAPRLQPLDRQKTLQACASGASDRTSHRRA
jgi:hypothetical protein